KWDFFHEEMPPINVLPMFLNRNAFTLFPRPRQRGKISLSDLHLAESDEFVDGCSGPTPTNGLYNCGFRRVKEFSPYFEPRRTRIEPKVFRQWRTFAQNYVLFQAGFGVSVANVSSEIGQRIRIDYSIVPDDKSRCIG